MVGGRAHLAAIAQGLGDEDTGVWRAALAAATLVGQPGDELLTEPLAVLAAQAVGTSSVDVAAARLRIGEPEGQATLTSLLQSPIPTPEARLRAAVALAQAGQLPATALRQALEGALRAGSVPPLLRRAALVRLALLHDGEALKQLSALAHPAGKASEKDPLHDEALQVLALAQQPHAMDELRKAAESAQGERRLEFAVTLAEAGDKHAAGLLLPLVGSTAPKVRKRALGALCRLAKGGHYPAYTTTVKPLLSDADPQVALIAAVALLPQSPPSAKPAEPPHE
jgi:HEAT repeat protein